MDHFLQTIQHQDIRSPRISANKGNLGDSDPYCPGNTAGQRFEGTDVEWALWTVSCFLSLRKKADTQQHQLKPNIIHKAHNNNNNTFYVLKVVLHKISQRKERNKIGAWTYTICQNKLQ